MFVFDRSADAPMSSASRGPYCTCLVLFIVVHHVDNQLTIQTRFSSSFCRLIASQCPFFSALHEPLCVLVEGRHSSFLPSFLPSGSLIKDIPPTPVSTLLAFFFHYINTARQRRRRRCKLKRNNLSPHRDERNRPSHRAACLVASSDWSFFFLFFPNL